MPSNFFILTKNNDSIANVTTFSEKRFTFYRTTILNIMFVTGFLKIHS